MSLKTFIHHLLEPHCAYCKEEKRYDPLVETLREVIESERYNNKVLMNTLIEHLSPKTETVPMISQREPVRTAPLPWRVRQQMLEENDRARAKVKAEQTRNQSVEELEKELGVAESNSTHEKPSGSTEQG